MTIASSWSVPVVEDAFFGSDIKELLEGQKQLVLDGAAWAVCKSDAAARSTVPATARRTDAAIL